MTSLDLGGGTCLATSHDPSGGYWDKTLGIGITEPVTRELIEQVTASYATHGGDNATIQIAPSALPADWAEIGVEGPGDHHPSLHDLRRAGFADRYVRPHWVWRRDAGRAATDPLP